MEITKELLVEKYLTDKKSWKQVAAELGEKRAYVMYLAKQYGIKSRANTFTTVYENLVGQKFAQLLVVEQLENSKTGHRKWRCLCDCGKYHNTSSSQLKKGGIKSCGCLNHLSGKKSSKWVGYEDISGAYWWVIKNRCKRYKRELSVSIEYTWNIFIEQNRKCYLTGIPLIFAKNYRDGKKEQTASLDRIDSSKGYIEGNVRWVHKDIQKMKWDYKLKNFINYCQLIINNLQNINPAYLE